MEHDQCATPAAQGRSGVRVYDRVMDHMMLDGLETLTDE
jgi:hypothetical protein